VRLRPKLYPLCPQGLKIFYADCSGVGVVRWCQVDYVIKEATSLDNLAVLYEGWTPWV